MTKAGSKTILRQTKSEPPTKDATYWSVLSAAVILDTQKGHQKWTITQLSKKSKVSRTLIYYYFGSSKIEILTEAVTTIAYEMAGMSQDRFDLWKTGKTAESLSVTRKILKDNPPLLHFYILNRTSENVLGEIIRKAEKTFTDKLSQVFPGLDPVSYESLFALFFGIGWFQNLSDASVKRAVEIVLNGIKR